MKYALQRKAHSVNGASGREVPTAELHLDNHIMPAGKGKKQAGDRPRAESGRCGDPRVDFRQQKRQQG
jgi:hypothetical protein